MFRSLLFLLLVPSLTLFPKPPSSTLFSRTQFGYHQIGYHNPEWTTPHLDALMKDGILLDRHYVVRARL